MLKNNRKILMILDNAPVHPKDIELTNVELLFFPPNTTSKIQPLDQGIIKAFKDWYRKILLSEMTKRMEDNKELNFEQCCKKITILDAILWSSRAWDKVTVETVQNCFNKGIENCYNPEGVNDIKPKTINFNPVVSEEEDELPTYCVLPLDEKEMIASIIKEVNEEKNNVEVKEENLDAKVDHDYTFLEAFNAIEKLENYVIKYLPGGVYDLWKVKEELVESRKSRSAKITDWLVHKK